MDCKNIFIDMFLKIGPDGGMEVSTRGNSRVFDKEIQQDLRMRNGEEVCWCQFLRTREMCSYGNYRGIKLMSHTSYGEELWKLD